MFISLRVSLKVSLRVDNTSKCINISLRFDTASTTVTLQSCCYQKKKNNTNQSEPIRDENLSDVVCIYI